MFRNTFHTGFLSIYYAVGSKPLQIWDVQAKDGTVEPIIDQELESTVLSIQGANISTTLISCPSDSHKTLGIKLPWIVFLVKNLDEHFSLEIEIMDDKKYKRRFRASTFQGSTRVTANICTMPVKLESGWNQIKFNLEEFCSRAYGTHFSEALRVSVNANCRLRRIYFCDKSYTEAEVPAEFKLFKVVQRSEEEEKRPDVAAAAEGDGGQEAEEEQSLSE